MSSSTEQLKLQNALKVPLTAFRRRAFLLTHHFHDKLDILHLILVPFLQLSSHNNPDGLFACGICQPSAGVNGQITLCKDSTESMPTSSIFAFC